MQSAYDLPRDALSLMPYDSVIFVNAGAELFDPVQFKAIHDAVKDLGIGYLMVGGRNSFGPGGYHKTAIEEILPVSMDVTKKKVLPKGALVIVLHTCEFPEGNTYAKRVSKEAIRVLGSQDEAGMLGLHVEYVRVGLGTHAGERLRRHRPQDQRVPAGRHAVVRADYESRLRRAE